MATLVGYATRHGAARGVAERIAETLSELDLDVHLRPLTGLENAEPYDAVVFGSAVYSSAWLEEANRFARRNARAFDRVPAWAFTVGRLCDRDGVPEWFATDTHRFFVLSSFERDVFASAGGRYGGLRDWPEIDTWAYRIGEQIAQPSLAGATR